MKKCSLLFFLLLPFVLKAQTGIISTILGNGMRAEAGDGGLAISAKTSGCALGIFDTLGNYYFTEVLGHRIRKIAPSGIVTSIAGNGTAGFSGDGTLAATAQLSSPKCIATDRLGNLNIADYANYRIRKVNVSTGIITTVVGNGTPGYSGDGVPATAASISSPYGVCIDPFGNMYISTDDNLILKVNKAGIISTAAGILGKWGYYGDGGPATAAAILTISQLCSDKYGNIFLTGVNIREINASTGYIYNVAGDTSVMGYTGDGGPATAAQLNGPYSIAMSHHGFLYIADRLNNRIRKIDSSGIITTVVGNGTQGFFGDGGKDTAAELNWPEGIAFDSCDNMYIDEINNFRIRKVTYPIIPSTISVSAPSVAAIGSSVTATASVTNVGTKYSIEWMNYGTVFATTAVPSVTYTKTMVVDNITAKIIPNACYDTAISESVTVSSPAEGTAIPPGMQLVSIFPNPANDVLYINNLQTAAGYRLLTVVGSVIQQGKLLQGNNSISTRALPKGMYMLEISSPTSGESLAEVKIVKQ